MVKKKEIAYGYTGSRITQEECSEKMMTNYSGLLVIMDQVMMVNKTIRENRRNKTHLRSNRLIIASSRSNGLLVAARTRIRSPGFVIRPSQ
jgi:hypothetical protein